MNPHARYAGTRVLLALLSATVGFLLLQRPLRVAETNVAAGLLHSVGDHHAEVVFGTSILVTPPSHSAFRAEVTPSCSSLASLIALGCLSSLTPGPSRARRAGALAVALATVAAGNLLRLAGSVAVGYVAGRSSLVLFHDWVGSVFTFVYTLGGYILMIALVLPAARTESLDAIPR
jgi:exosortase/archaeosortase family protein